MKAVSHSKITNCTNQLKLTSVLLLITLFLLISGKGLGQTVDFSASSTVVCSGSSVIFTDNSTGISALATYSWDFGTGASPSTLTGIGPHAVTYTGSGPDTVSLTITDGMPVTVTKADYITVNALPAVSLASAGPFCLNSTAEQLVGSPSGGSYSGSGVSGTGLFTPATAGAGSHVITYTYTDGNSCTSSASDTITVNATPTVLITNPAEVCSPATVNLTADTVTSGSTALLTYTYWTDALATVSYVTPAIATAGTYYIKGTEASGCFDIRAVTVTVNPLPIPALTSSDADNIFCAGTSVTFTAGGGTSYNFMVGGASKQIGPSDIYTSNSLTNGQVVSVLVTNAKGCTAASAGITNFVNSLPFIFVTTPAACSADLATYSLGVTVSSGTVTSTSGTVTNAGGNVWSITGAVSGVNITIKVTDGNSCENIMVVTAPDCLCPIVSAPVSGGDKSYCASGIIPTITATVTTGETVDWYNSSSDGILLAGGSLSYTPSAAGTWFAMARNLVTGCVSSTRTPVTVTMNALPVTTLTSSDADNILCAGTSVTFTAGGGTSYDFMVGVVSVQNGASPTYITSSLTNGQIVSVLVTNANGCSAASAGIINTVNALPLVNAGSDTVICKGSGFQLHAQGTGSILWAPAALVSNPDITDPVATPVTTTTFTVTLTDQSGCKNSDGIVIEVRDNPVADAGNDQLLEYQLGTTMNAVLAHDYERGLWALISGTGEFFDASDPQTSVDKLSLGENKFSWTVTNGVCPASGDTVLIIVYDIRISTLITPNMDGKNDYFVLNGLINMGKTELVIFDRRGVQVYKNGNYDNLWNGVDYNGNPLPDDTYFYVIKSEKGKSVSGFIVIRR